MSPHLIPKEEFDLLLDSADTSASSKEKFLFAIADRILSDWDGVSFSSLGNLSPGQTALVCCSEFHRGAAHDFITSITSSELPSLTLRALETIQATEYFELLRKIEAVFPGKSFPEYAEDMLAAYRKLPDDYFDNAADKFVTGKGMTRRLVDYVFDYVTIHPEEFCVMS